MPTLHTSPLRARPGWLALWLALVVGCSDGAPQPVEFTRESFQQDVLQRYSLVVVGFTADDDGEQGQLLEAALQVRDQSRGAVPWVSVLTTPDDWVHQEYDVRRTPVLVAYHNGKEAGRLLAPIRERQLTAWLETLANLQPAVAAEPQVAKLDLKTADFDSTLAESDVPVLVEFWATWCGPCLMLDEPLQQIADDYAGRLTVAKLNIDAEREVARRFVNGGIPLLVLFHRGQELDRLMGARPDHLIRDWIDESLQDLK